MYSNYFKVEIEKSDFPQKMGKLLEFLTGKKIVFYGIGDELKYYLDNCNFKNLDVVAISDTNLESEVTFEGYQTTFCQNLKNIEFDYVLITQDNLLRAENFLINQIGIPKEKIVNVLRLKFFDEEINIEYLKKIAYKKAYKRLCKKLQNKSVIIYGKNTFLSAISKICDLSKLNILAISDLDCKSGEAGEFLGYKTIAASEIPQYSPDYVLVAEKYFSQEIIEHLYFSILSETQTKIFSIIPQKFSQILNKNFVTEENFSKEDRVKKIKNFLSIKFFEKPLYSFLPKYELPNRVRLEACTICQLHCKSCYMRRDGPGVVGYGYLKFQDYKNFVDDNPQIKSISISNSGEIFLNPDLVEILKYSYEKGIKLDAHTGVNLNNLTDEQAEALVKYEFGDMILSIDGASQETYVQYRAKGDFDNVINNIKKINFYKKKYNSMFPNMIWKFILFNHNEHEIIKAKEMAKELGVGIVFSLPWGKNTYIPKNADFVTKETGLQFASVKSMESTTKKKFSLNLCARMFEAPQINYDGKLLGCCILYKEWLGVNVFEQGLKKALRSAEFLYSIGMLRGKYFPLDSSPCTKCNEYDIMTYNEAYFKE